MALFTPAFSQAQLSARLQLLNTAVHDTIFLKHAPEMNYPVVFAYQQENYLQESADAPLKLFSGDLNNTSYTQINIETIKWHEEKQLARFKMSWNDKIVKLRLRSPQANEQVSAVRGMKVRKKKRFWPSYVYMNAEM